MCSNNDSDATYCSEVEEMIKGDKNLANKICEERPLRRSQRLTQKLNKSIANKCVERKYSLDIFSTFAAREEEGNTFEELRSQHGFSINEIPSCHTQIRKHIPESCGVPLDLSKSKVSTGETLARKVNGETIPLQFNIANVKATSKRNVTNEDKIQQQKPFQNKVLKKDILQNLDAVLNTSCVKFSADNKNCQKQGGKNLQGSKENVSIENGALPQILQQDLLDNNKSLRRKKSSAAKCSNLVPAPVVNLPRIKNSNILHGVNYFENISFDNTNCFSGRCTGISKKPCENCFEIYLNDSAKQKLSKRTNKSANKTGNSKKVPKLFAKSFSETAERQMNKTISCVKYFNESENILCNKKNYKRGNKNLQLTKTIKNVRATNKLKGKNEINIRSNKKNQLTNELFNNKSSKLLAEKDIKSSTLNALETKSKIKTKIGNGTSCSKRESVIRYQKRKHQAVENGFETENQSNVKSEAFTQLDMCKNTIDETSELLSENKMKSRRVKNILLNKELKYRGRSKCNINKNYSGVSGATILTENGYLQSSLPLRTGISSGEPKKAKLEPSQINTSQNNYADKKVKKTSEYAFSAQEIKNSNIDTHLASSIEKSICYTENIPFNPTQGIQQANVNSQVKAESESSNITEKRNYIKSFDRNQFLDKIQRAKNCIDILSSVQKNNFVRQKKFEIPLTPAESLQGLTTNANISDDYPSYFKHQLTPQALLTHAVDLQPYPTNVITPDDTISSEQLDSSSSSPSLPESLCERFQTTNIKTILNVEKTSYRLNRYHIQALALILNVHLDYLVKIIENVSNISPNVLKNMEKAVKKPFVPDEDIFSSYPADVWAGSDVVINSQSPVSRIIPKTNNQIPSQKSVSRK